MNFNFDETHTYPPPLAGEVDRRRVSGDAARGARGGGGRVCSTTSPLRPFASLRAPPPQAGEDNEQNRREI